MPATDHDLITAFRAGDEAAFAELVRRHAALVRATCRRICGADDAEDAFQATFLALAVRARSLSGRGGLAGWLHEVARRVALGLTARAEARRRRERAAATQAATASAEPADELAAHLDEALARLPERYRLPLLLRYAEERSDAEIAAELGLRPGAVAVRLTRAREMLRAGLARRGVVVPAATALAALAAGAPVGDAAEMAKSALAVANGAEAPMRVAAALRATLQAMRVAKAKAAALAVAALVVVALAPLAALRLVGADAPREPPPQAAHGDLVPDGVAVAEWVAAAGGGSAGGRAYERGAFRFEAEVQEEHAEAGKRPRPVARIGDIADDNPPPIVGGHEEASLYGTMPFRDPAPVWPWKIALGPPIATRTTSLVLVSPVLQSGETWSPYLLARDGSVITCVVDVWTADAVRMRNVPSLHGMRVDLGRLQTGDYTLRLMYRTFHRDQIGGEAAWRPQGCAIATRSFSVYDAQMLRQFTFAPGKEPTDIPIDKLENVRDARRLATFSLHGDRFPPAVLRLSLAPAAGRDPGLAQYAVGRFDLAAWLDSKPTTTDDLPSTRADGKDALLIVVGPALRREERIDPCDWFAFKPGKDSLMLRLDRWTRPDTAAGSEVVPVLVLRLPDGHDPGRCQPSIDWRTWRPVAGGGFDLAEERIAPYREVAGSSWRASGLVAPPAADR